MMITLISKRRSPSRVTPMQRLSISNVSTINSNINTPALLSLVASLYTYTYSSVRARRRRRFRSLLCQAQPLLTSALASRFTTTRTPSSHVYAAHIARLPCQESVHIYTQADRNAAALVDSRRRILRSASPSKSSELEQPEITLYRNEQGPFVLYSMRSLLIHNKALAGVNIQLRVRRLYEDITAARRRTFHCADHRSILGLIRANGRPSIKYHQVRDHASSTVVDF
jgi:hypothetical protein